MFIQKFRTAIAKLPRPWRIFLVSIIGYTVLISGAFMLLLPGPGTVAVLVGLAILAIEFEWAREVSKNGQQWLERLVSRIKHRFNRDKRDH